MNKKEQMNAWRDDPRMVFLVNPGRDLTKKEIEQYERNIRQYQVEYRPEIVSF